MFYSKFVYDIQMLLTYVVLTKKCYFLWLKLHSLGSATINNAAYSVNLGFKFHSLDDATIYNDA